MLNNIVKAVLLLSLAHQSSGDKDGKAIHYKTCRQLCKDYLQGDFKTSNVCQGAHNIEPAHSEIHKACVKGKFMGFEHACMPACMGEDYLGREGVTLGSSHEACKKYWKKPAPNNQLPWCRRGYDYAYDTVQKEIQTFVSTEEVLGLDENIKSPANVEQIQSENQIQGDEREEIVHEKIQVQKLSVPSKNTMKLKSQEDENILKSAKIEPKMEEDEKSSSALPKAPPVLIHNQDKKTILKKDVDAQPEENSNVPPKEGTENEKTAQIVGRMKHGVDSNEKSEELFNEIYDKSPEKEPFEWDKIEELTEVKGSRSLKEHPDQL